jgi:hypothetical protein
MTTPHAHPQEPQCDTGYGVGYLSHHEVGSNYPSHGYPKPSLRDETSASARYPDWYAPLEWYISYGVDQAERAMEGIGQLERQISRDASFHRLVDQHDARPLQSLQD